MISAIAVNVLSGNVYAATLDDIIYAISLPAKTSNTDQNWSTLDAMQRVKWKPKSARRDFTTGKAYPDSFERIGTVELTTTIKKRPHIKFTTYAAGDKNQITTFEINTKGHFGEAEVNLQTMKKFFNSPLDVRVSRPACQSFSYFTNWDLYTVNLPNKKPVFIKVGSFIGGDSHAIPTTTFTFQYAPFSEDDLSCNATN